MANSVDPDQTAPIGAVCSGSMLFVSILNLSVMLGDSLEQTTSADNIFRCIFFLTHVKTSWKKLRELLPVHTSNTSLTRPVVMFTALAC